MKFGGFTFMQQIPNFSQDSLPYSTIFPIIWELRIEKNTTKKVLLFLGVKTLSWNVMLYKIT